jgi:hypothetical protein
MFPRNVSKNQPKSKTGTDFLANTGSMNQHDYGHDGNDPVTKSQQREEWSNSDSKKARDRERRTHRDNKAALLLLGILPGEEAIGEKVAVVEEEAMKEERIEDMEEQAMCEFDAEIYWY